MSFTTRRRARGRLTLLLGWFWLLATAGCGDRGQLPSEAPPVDGQSARSGEPKSVMQTDRVPTPQKTPTPGSSAAPRGDTPVTIGNARWFKARDGGVLPILGFDYRWRGAPPESGELFLAFMIVNGPGRERLGLPERVRHSVSLHIPLRALRQTGTLYSGNIIKTTFLQALEFHLELDGRPVSNVVHVSIPDGEYSTLATVGVFPPGAQTINDLGKPSSKPSTNSPQPGDMPLLISRVNRVSSKLTVVCRGVRGVQRPRLSQETQYSLTCHYRATDGADATVATLVPRHLVESAYSSSGKYFKTDSLTNLDASQPVRISVTATPPGESTRPLAHEVRFLPAKNELLD